MSPLRTEQRPHRSERTKPSSIPRPRCPWPRAESRIYDEAKRLVERGLATAHEERVGQRPRTLYAITPAGRRAVEEWLATPPRATTLECEPLLRVFLAAFCSREQLLGALAQVRADADAILAQGRIVGPEYLQSTAPFQDQVPVRTLVFDFLWNHALMLRQWAERTEEGITRRDEMSAEERATAGLATIATLLADDAAPWDITAGAE